ncbi:MAG: HEPN domain-containing protein [Coriobacteriia bacterium]
MSDRRDPEDPRSWLDYADADLHAARVLAGEDDGFPMQVCAFCQQAAEKYLKAVLVAGGCDVPRIHGLVELRALTGRSISEQVTDGELEELTKWIVVGRYPTVWEEPTSADAAVALRLAEVVGVAVRGIISGFPE